ncbi:MAG TPA: hypothetical protein VF735_15310 [Pyrinomonadaceae bacterium]
MQSIIKSLTGAAAFVVVSCSDALAQCAMCKAAVASSADSAAKASGMNLAVLVLLIPPLAMFCAFFVAAYRFRKAPGETPASDIRKGKSTRRAALDEVDKGGRSRLRAKGDDPTASALG